MVADREVRGALAQLAVVPCRPLQVSVQGETGSAWLAVCIATSLHALALGSLVMSPPREIAGAGGQYLEAIEVTIVPTRVLESRNLSPNAKVDAANTSLAKSEGEATEATPRSRNAATTPELLKPEAHDPEAAFRLKPNAATPTLSEGGAIARGEDGKEGVAASAAASPGAVQKYAAEVRAALAASKPKGQGLHGTAIVTFEIKPSGDLAYAHITSPSGNTKFDAAVLAGVQRAKFPAAPTNMTDAQRTFIVPFRLK